MTDQPIEDDGFYRCPVCGERCDEYEGEFFCPYCRWPEEERVDEE